MLKKCELFNLLIFIMELDKIFENIMNESSLKEHFFYAPPHHEEDEEDNIIGYIAAVRDYQTHKTKYIDDDGNVCSSKSQAKVFDTKGKADYYSYEYCPEGWTHFVAALKKSEVLNENIKQKRLKETADSTSAAFNLTKLKGYLRFETKWDYDEDEPEDVMLVDKVHNPARFTVNWIGPKGKKHPNTYCVNIRKDKGESWTWITHFCLKASDAAEMINLEVRTWERNNMSWKFESDVLNESIKQKRFKEAKITVGDFCDNSGIENPEAFRDFLRKLWDFDHVELWSMSSLDSLEIALDKYEKLNNKTYITKFGDSFKGANMTVGEFCDIKDIKNPENFRDFLRKLWDFDHVETWSTSSYDGLERALAKYKELNESKTTKYMACCYDPEDYYEETSYIDEDGELSCNSSGAKLFDTEDEAIEYADENKPIDWVSFAMTF